MTTTHDQDRFLQGVALDAPWEPVERFATLPRCNPCDVYAACESIT